MYFLMVCRHHDGMDEKREAVRGEHKEWVVSGGEGVASVPDRLRHAWRGRQGER